MRREDEVVFLDQLIDMLTATCTLPLNTKSVVLNAQTKK